jgi:hypothetical protein
MSLMYIMIYINAGPEAILNYPMKINYAPLISIGRDCFVPRKDVVASVVFQQKTPANQITGVSSIPPLGG